MWIPFVAAVIFFAGVGAGEFLEWPWEEWVLPALILTLLLRIKGRKEWFLVLAFCIGVGRVLLFVDSMQADVPLGEWVDLKGTIVEEVDERPDRKNLTLDTEYGRILVKASPFQKVVYGETILVSGFLDFPLDEEGAAYARYLRLHGIAATLEAKKVDLLEEANLSFYGTLFSMKNWLQWEINRIYYEPEASFVSGLLLGSRKGIPEDLQMAFQRVGLTHIVAISGYNISLVIAAVFAIFSFVPLKKRIYLSIFCITLFVVLVGASAAVVRAALMGSLAMVGLYSGRKTQALFALLWSAVVMTLWNPFILLYDIGFQLSFASTLGLLVWAPLFQKRIELKHGNFIVEAALLTLTAQIATFPFMVFYFGRVSLVAPLVNVVVAPFLPWSMLLSGISLIGGKPVALLANFPLKVVENSALIFGSFAYADTSFTLDLRGFIISLCVLALGTLLLYKSKLMRAFGLCQPECVSTA